MLYVFVSPLFTKSCLKYSLYVYISQLLSCTVYNYMYLHDYDYSFSSALFLYRYFTSLCYTADGSCILAGGRSKFICIYNVRYQALLKKFQISRNRSFDGMMVGMHKYCNIKASFDSHSVRLPHYIAINLRRNSYMYMCSELLGK